MFVPCNDGHRFKLGTFFLSISAVLYFSPLQVKNKPCDAKELRHLHLFLGLLVWFEQVNLE
jgi:hypothetical protein